jgi:hypothetical protein
MMILVIDIYLILDTFLFRYLGTERTKSTPYRHMATADTPDGTAQHRTQGESEPNPKQRTKRAYFRTTVDFFFNELLEHLELEYI